MTGQVGMSRARIRRQRGLSLVELMIALGIIAIAMLGVVSVITHTIRSKEAHRELAIAKQAATAKLEEIRARASHADAFDSAEPEYIPTLYPSGTTFSVDALYRTGGLKGLGTITVDSTNTRLLDVQVTVAWDGVQGFQTYVARSLYTK